MQKQPFLIVDLDGTLIDTSKRHFTVYQDIATELKITPMPFNRYWTLRREGKSNFDVIKMNAGELTRSQEKLVEERWLEKIESLTYLNLDRPFDGVLEWLETTREKINIALITIRSQTENLYIQLKYSRWIDFFHQIIIRSHKDHPALSKINAVSTKIPFPFLWIGDTEADILAAKALGVYSIGVSSGMRNDESLLEYGADEVYKQITDIDITNYLHKLSNK